MVQNEIKNNILSFEPYNEILCKLRIKGKFNNLFIISIQVPTEEKIYDEKEHFYEDLQIVHNKIPKYDIVIILGDLNAKIGKEEVYQNVAGEHTLHEISTRNREWVCEYAIANNMKIKSTYYQHKRIHKGTWISSDGNTLNQTDHVITDANRKGVVEDVRTMQGLNCDSDNFLVKTIIKQKLIRTQNNAVKQKKWNQSNLQNPAKLNQYRSCLSNKLTGKEVQQDIEEEWKNITETIIESANEVIQTQNTSNRNEWWDESCKLIMTQKNEARKKYLQAKTKGSREIHEMKRTEANRVCRDKGEYG